MGAADEMVAPVEHELRVYTHDLITPSHEKDFRSLSVFCLEDMAEARFIVLRADYRGGLVVEAVQGQRWEPGGWDVWALIWKGHMTLIQPPENLETSTLWDREEPVTTPAMGFGFFWHTRHDQPKTAPGRVVCRLCKPGRKAGEGFEQYVRQHSCLSQLAVVAGGGPPKEEVVRLLRPTRGSGEHDTLLLQELFAGTGAVTKEWSANGQACPPVELYEEPHIRKGPREAHDLTKTQVQSRVLKKVKDVDGPNVGWIASPCTSYCDWQLQNGGTRTFDNPYGTGKGPLAQSEDTGNRLSVFSAQYFTEMLNAGGFPVAESSAPSGRYPKQWDLPEWKAVLSREDVEWVDLPMCAFKLGPIDQPNHYYVHRTRVVFPRHAPLRRALQRTCPGLSPSHQHVALKGSREGTSVTRCTEAGAYAQEFVQAVVGVLQSTMVGSGGAGFPTTQSEDEELEKLPCTRGPDGGDCGMCRACCQGKFQCRLCVKCRGKGLFPVPKYARREQRMAGGNEEMVPRGVWAPIPAERTSESGNPGRSRSPTRRSSRGNPSSSSGNPLGTRAEDPEEPFRREDEVAEDAGATAAGTEDAATEAVELEARDAEAESREGADAPEVNTEDREPRAEDVQDGNEERAGGHEEAVEEGEEEADEEAEDPIVVAARGRGPRLADYWFPTTARGQLERLHVNPRSRLYVPDFDTTPVPLENLRNERDTIFTTARGARVMVRDDWRAEGAIELGYGQWVGASRFYLVASPLPPLRSRSEVENFEGTETEPEASPGEGYISSEGGEVLPQLDAANQVHAGSKQRGARGEQNCAYKSPTEEAKVSAKEYVDEVKEFDNSRRAWSRLVSAGNKLLETAGSVEEAAKSLWQVREEEGLSNLRGVDDPSLEGVIHQDLLSYLRDVRKFGMPARFVGTRARMASQPHPNARKHLKQVFKQIGKDVGKHRILLVGAKHPLLRAVSSPFEAVDKMLPDRTISEDKRIVHDQRGVNRGTDKYLHPPAIQPSHQQIARRILWTKVRCPNIPVVMAKKDIAGAFRLLWLDPSDVELFGGDLPWKSEAFEDEETGEERQCTGGVTVLYLVSSFGFSGSPGEWTMWGHAAEDFHRMHKPQEPRRDMGMGFDGKILVDDFILVEPMVGLRPWVSAEVFEEGVRTLLGEAAINAEKDKIEGDYRTAQTVWGVVMDSVEERAYLPERRIQKGAQLLAEKEFDYGSKEATLKHLQRFRGIMTGWASVVRGLQNELRAADKFLGGCDGGEKVRPTLKGDGSREWEEEHAWHDLWELFEACRWLSARSEMWPCIFSAGLKELLPPMERVTLPGEWDRVTAVSSDATPTTIGAIDWTHHQVFRISVEKLKPWVNKVLTDRDRLEKVEGEIAIHVGEMLSFVAFACAAGERWRGTVVIYGGDNSIVKSWLQTRKAGVRAGKLLIRVVNLIEMRYGCVILAGWWRTYHNVDADFITRCTDHEYQAYIEKKELKEIAVEAAIQRALEDTERFGPCFLSWATEEDRVTLMQLKEKRMFRHLQREIRLPWKSFQVEEWSQQGRRVKDFEQVARELGARPFEEGGADRLLCGSLSTDPYGKMLARFLECAERSKAKVALAEGPRAVAWELGEKFCQRRGWNYDLVEFVTTEFGEALARRRKALVIQCSEAKMDWHPALVRAEVAVPASTLLRTPRWDDEQAWYRPKRLEIEGGAPRDPLLAQVVGHYWDKEDAERKNAYGLGGPIRWPLYDPGVESLEKLVVFDRKGPPGCLRKVTGWDVWRLQGHSTGGMQEKRASQGDFWALEGTGIHTANSLLAVGGYLLHQHADEERKAGMAEDREGAEALASILVWLRRWKRGDLPRAEAGPYAGGNKKKRVWRWPEAWWFTQIEEDSSEDEGRYAGGRKRKVEEVIGGAAILNQEVVQPVPFEGQVASRVEDWLEENLTGDKAASTERAYAGSWMKWKAWAKRQGWESEYLNRKDDPVENENKVMAFIGYLGWLGGSAATLKQAVFAIKDAHKKAGAGDPTEKMHRLWILTNAMERKAIKRPRRLGVTPAMLIWLGQHLVDPLENDKGGGAYADAVMVQASMVTAWFFMLRAREYSDSNGVDEEMVLRGCDLRFSKDGEREDGEEANEVTMQFRKTKNDQLAFGESKTLKATMRNHVCPVQALLRMKKVWKLRFKEGHPDSKRPLFRWASGAMLKRVEIQHFLQQAAKGVGLPPERFMSHSLRIGGATALYQSTGEIELVKRMGRWNSAAVQRYLHDGGETLPKVSQKMASLPSTVHYT